MIQKGDSWGERKKKMRVNSGVAGAHTIYRPGDLRQIQPAPVSTTMRLKLWDASEHPPRAFQRDFGSSAAFPRSLTGADQVGHHGTCGR
jgi:hypothetical protein